MKKKLYSIWSKFLTVFGDIKFFRFPLFFVYDPDDFKITGNKTLEIIDTLKPGDIVLRGFDRYLDGKLINILSIDSSNTAIGGDWSHAAIYIGNGKLIHAVSEGVSEVDIVEFTRCDRICIFRAKKLQKTAIKKAKKFMADNIPYDFSFEYGASALYCFELAALCYEKLNIPTFNFSKFFGLINKKNVYVAQSFLNSDNMKLVFCYNPKHKIDYLLK